MRYNIDKTLELGSETHSQIEQLKQLKYDSMRIKKPIEKKQKRYEENSATKQAKRNLCIEIVDSQWLSNRETDAHSW